MSSEPEFSWDEADAVIPEQPKTAIYANTDGQVVIVQASSLGDEDSMVVIANGNALAVVRAILDRSGHQDVQFIYDHGGLCRDIDSDELRAGFARAPKSQDGDLAEFDGDRTPLAPAADAEASQQAPAELAAGGPR
ncbi:hypothetical protein JQ615_18400 [Bradyrhizobium jicamae]|uniref:Uncharacterized protein n=1 Tax=Bradyrhizobium jicamae TaxID=280332 RepID=A0ABS5FKP4_9BRAD|nr:hypothetical protein [Bradyrhizobium jicamae]MBR0797362.1 hypothetical protein [Bradyrhizobium jicamae]